MNQDRAKSSPRRTTSWRGRFIDGVWHCDCDPRLPADHFQTKKEGVNHGRWFYTCQKPQGKRCKFFLWDEDAQIREKHTVLANSRSEPDTPKKSSSISGLPTPGTGTGTGRAQASENRRQDIAQTPTKVRRTQATSSDEETYSWDEDFDDEAGNLLGSNRLKQPIFSPTTPKKTPQTVANTSPGKRRLDDLDDQSFSYSKSVSTVQSNVTVSTVPFSPEEASTTPTPRRYKDVLSANVDALHISELSSNILSILDRHDVVVPIQARNEVVASLDQHHLKTQGIVRGRDMSRMALKKKDEEIKHLKERIESLETEREMDKVVITCLRSDANAKR